MKKLNIVRIQLPCHSLDCDLTTTRTLAIDKIIKDAESDYRQAHGNSLAIVTGYSMVNNKVVLSIWQMPRSDVKQKNFTQGAVSRGK